MLIIQTYHAKSLLNAPVWGSLRSPNNYHHQLHQTVFSECTEAIATSLIQLYTILLEICAPTIGFNCTVWTKMRSMAGLLADGVLADAISSPSNIGMVRGPRKKYGN